MQEKSENQVTIISDEVNLCKGFSENAFEAAKIVIETVSMALAEIFNKHQMRRTLTLRISIVVRVAIRDVYVSSLSFW